MQRSRENAFAFGNAGDDLVRQILRAGGEFVFPNSDADKHGAPMARGPAANDIMPDLTAAAAGHSRFVEVKTKETSTLRHVTGVMETGCCLRHVEHYQRVQKNFGLPVHMVLVHLAQDEVLTGKLNDLMRNARVANDPWHRRDVQRADGVLSLRFRADEDLVRFIATIHHFQALPDLPGGRPRSNAYRPGDWAETLKQRWAFVATLREPHAPFVSGRRL